MTHYLLRPALAAANTTATGDERRVTAELYARRHDSQVGSATPTHIRTLNTVWKDQP